jgi:pimeloyl-ACP methyl ester carboxylesterase
VLWLWSRPSLFRMALRSGRAVHDADVLTPELLAGYVRANLGDAHRRRKTRRFLAGQLDPQNHRATSDVLPGLRRFDHPTLLVWAKDDPHFGPEWAERLRAEIPGAERVELLADTGHLLMEERPRELAGYISEFLRGGQHDGRLASPTSGDQP